MQKNDHKFMRGLSTFIVDKKILFAVLFLALMVFSVFSYGWVNIEDNIIQFLPAGAESKVCLDIMEEEFVTYGNGQIVVENIDEQEAARLAEELRAIEHVDSITFEPDTDYQNGTALFNFNFDTEASTEENAAVTAAVREVLAGYNSYLYDDSANSDVSKVVADQMKVVILIVAVVVVGVLLLTSGSYGEVFVLLLTFVAAALINAGTNFLLGTISMIADSVSLVLQLALSIDYAVILCHRYKEEREHLGKREAVIEALTGAIPSILASSLTTVAGLVAMTFMRFRLGYDLGRVLIKAIVISLLTVFLFMPFLLMIFDGFIQKTKHKRFIPKVSFLGKFARVGRVVMPFILILAILFGGFMSTRTKYAYDLTLSPAYNELESSHAQRIAETDFHQNMFALLIPAGDYAAEKAVIEKLEDREEVTSVLGLASINAVDGYALGDTVNYADFCEIAEIEDETTGKALFAYYAAEYGDHRELEKIEDYRVPLIDIFLFVHDKCLGDPDLEFTAEQTKTVNDLYEQLSYGRDQLQGKHYSRVLVYTNLPMQDDETYRFLDDVHAIGNEYYSTGILICGDSMVDYDFHKSFADDILIVTLLSILFVLIILFFTFRSVALPVLLIAVIEGSILLNFAIPALMGSYTYFVCYLIVSAIQMGSNIDYAIVISSRYLEMRKTMEKKQAVVEAMNLAFPTVITTGLIMVVAGGLINFIVSEGVTAGIGRYVAVGTFITMLLVLFFLPAVLVLCDKLIAKTTLKSAEKEKKDRKPLLARFAALVLAIVSVLTVALSPIGYNLVRSNANETIANCTEQLGTLTELEDTVTKRNQSKEDIEALKKKFAEEYLVDQMGADELVKGSEEYQKGKEKLEQGEKDYADAYAKYQQGLAEYQAGKGTYDTGYAEYQAALKEYEKGLEAYRKGKEAYDQGVKEYEEGKAAYDEGKALYDASLEEYNTAKQTLTALETLYNLINPYYQQYQMYKKQYDAAVAAGNTEEATRIQSQMALLQTVFDTQLGEFGSVTELLDQFRDAKVELAAAEKELKAAEKELKAGEKKLKASEKKLAAAKAELTAAEEELAAAEKELAAAKAELDAGKKKIDAGGAELSSAEQQLKDARKELDDGHSQLDGGGDAMQQGEQYIKDNKKKLEGSLDELDAIADEDEKLEKSEAILMAVPGINSTVERPYTYAELYNASRIYYNGLKESAAQEKQNALTPCVFMVLAGLLGLLASVVLLIGKKFNAVLIGGILSAACAVVGGVMWYLLSPDMVLISVLAIAIFVLALIAVGFAVSGMHKNEKPAVEVTAEN